MFGLGGKKTAPAASRARAGQAAGGKPRNLAQFGLLDMGLMDTGLPDEDDDDSALEAELAALTRGNAPARKKAQKPVVSPEELDAMISSSLRDIPSDAEVSDVDDAEVEDELNELCGEESDHNSPEPEDKKEPEVNSQQQLSTLQERLTMYQQAEKVANLSGDTMKAKRYGRGVKSIQDMLKAAKAGGTINMDDVPPVLAASTQKVSTTPAKTEPATPQQSVVPVVPPNVPTPRQETLSPEKDVPLRPPPVPVREAPPLPPRPTVPPSVPNSSSVSAPAPAPPPRSASVPATRNPPEMPTKSEPAVSPEIALAMSRRGEFKNAALEAKRAGDQASALQFVRQVKACDQLISAAQQGTAVDWSQLPPPIVKSTSIPTSPPRENIGPQKEEKPIESSEPEVPPKTTRAEAEPAAETKQIFDVPPAPRSTLEALEQRLAKYQNSMEQAQAENNSSKVRRMGRIVKQYQDAIKAHKAGKSVPFDELPTPPGFPPIPGAPVKAEEDEGTGAATAAPPAATGAPAAAATSPRGPRPAPSVASPPSAKDVPKKTASATRQDKELAMLLERQSMFKQAALDAKKAGELPQAKEYLRMAKGFDPLISSNKCGIPVDMSTLPIPPQMKLRATLSSGGSDSKKKESAAGDGFEILSSEECAMAPALSGQDKSALLVQLENDLLAQLKICTDTRDNYKSMGDLANANRFDQLALYTRKDLDVVRSAALRGDGVPRWKNEMRTFSIVKCCTDLKDDDMEVTIVRGLSYNVPNPKTIDTYVRFEIPLPSTDNPTKDKTGTVRDTNNPEYNQSFHVTISRQSRTLHRIFKSKNAKFEVWAKGGFLRSDTLLGTATVKLADLVNHCILHEAVDLMDGRKVVGGKVEVKIRIRDPIVGKEVEQVQEKWTVLLN